jgi:tRNA(His) guanylyltransferase
MHFSELDSEMRVFETAHDHCVLPGIHIVARLDGRSFTKLTKETLAIENGKGVLCKVPFDDHFHKAMVATVGFLMRSVGGNILYGYTQSDEISLLFHVDDSLFSRKLRKLTSILAGETSAYFTKLMTEHAVFDCRVSQLPTIKNVVDYFRWRQEDAARNALSAYCFYTLRDKKGLSPNEAHERTLGLSQGAKNELLFEEGINFNDLPAWQKRGTGCHWTEIEKVGFNPKKNEPTLAKRRELIASSELPMRDEYSEFVRNLVSPRSGSPTDSLEGRDPLASHPR